VRMLGINGNIVYRLGLIWFIWVRVTKVKWVMGFRISSLGVISIIVIKGYNHYKLRVRMIILTTIFFVRDWGS
jgi:hypothetical protein